MLLFFSSPSRQINKLHNSIQYHLNRKKTRGNDCQTQIQNACNKSHYSVFLRAFDFWIVFFWVTLYLSTNALAIEKPRITIHRSMIISRIVVVTSSLHEAVYYFPSNHSSPLQLFIESQVNETVTPGLPSTNRSTLLNVSGTLQSIISVVAVEAETTGVKEK